MDLKLAKQTYRLGMKVYYNPEPNVQGSKIVEILGEPFDVNGRLKISVQAKGEASELVRVNLLSERLG